jgi:glycosyltransferase involved in cell wall biosynthesis
VTTVRATIAVPGRFHAFDLARELEKRGAFHRLLTSLPRSRAQAFGVPKAKVRSFLSLLAVNRIVDRVCPALAPSVYYRTNAMFSRWAAMALDGTNVLHGFAGYSWHSLLWAKRNRVPAVIDRSSSHLVVQTELLQEEHGRLGLPFWRPPSECIDREQEEYAQADLVAVPSLFVKRSFQAHGFAEGKLLHAPFGTDLSGFSPGIKIEPNFRAIFAGHLSVRKGIHYLIRGFQLANIRGSELLLMGSATPETPHLVSNAGSNVRFMGHLAQAQLVQHYRQASVFVMPSLEEGLAVVQAQALATGLPLICTTNTGGEDLLRMSGEAISSHDGIVEFPAGYMVPIRDPEAIARCLRQLSEDADLLESKRAAAIKLREAGLDWSRYADAVLMGYRTLLERA